MSASMSASLQNDDQVDDESENFGPQLIRKLEVSNIVS